MLNGILTNSLVFQILQLLILSHLRWQQEVKAKPATPFLDLRRNKETLKEFLKRTAENVLQLAGRQRFPRTGRIVLFRSRAGRLPAKPVILTCAENVTYNP